MLSACWQVSSRLNYTLLNIEPHSTLSAVHQGVPPFCEEINSLSQVFNSIESSSNCLALNSGNSYFAIKWLLPYSRLQDIDRCQFVSFLIFPFHYFY